jgi:hypothetical protein
MPPGTRHARQASAHYGQLKMQPGCVFVNQTAFFSTQLPPWNLTGTARLWRDEDKVRTQLFPRPSKGNDDQTTPSENPEYCGEENQGAISAAWKNIFHRDFFISTSRRKPGCCVFPSQIESHLLKSGILVQLSNAVESCQIPYAQC